MREIFFHLFMFFLFALPVIFLVLLFSAMAGGYSLDAPTVLEILRFSLIADLCFLPIAFVVIASS